MTVCADTIPYVADGVIQLEEMGLNFTANMAFEDHWGDKVNKAKLLEIYEDQLQRLVEYYSEHLHLFPVGPMLTAVPEYLGIPALKETKPEKIVRYCGAGHEMVVVDVDGERYPCHRFIPWVSNRPAPNVDVNCQTAWKSETCKQCKFLPSCPTCAGFNWEINGDTAVRTTFHCESYKKEVLASCILEWRRLRKRLEKFSDLKNDERRRIRMRINAIWELIENGL
jgi:radical SAM protein with 4Fe4S-binding SPASM domain